jgi:hypothetical protein
MPRPYDASIVTELGNIAVDQLPAGLQIRRGSFPGIANGDKFGYIANVGSGITRATPASWVDLWAYGIARTPPSGTFTPFMASNDAGDTDVPIAWTYLDADGLTQTITVNTDASDGTTPVSFGVTATEVFRGVAGAARAGDVHVLSANDFTSGDPTDDADLVAHIPALDGKTQQLMGRVPADKRYYLEKLLVRMARESGAASSCEFVFETQEPGGIFITERPFFLSTGSPVDGDLSTVTLEPSANFRVRLRDVSDNNSYIGGSLIFWEEDV